MKSAAPRSAPQPPQLPPAKPPHRPPAPPQMAGRRLRDGEVSEERLHNFFQIADTLDEEGRERYR